MCLCTFDKTTTNIVISAGWDCLGDAAQFGVILVIVSVVIVLVYLYWLLQIKPGLQGGRDDSQNPVTGYWELSRRDPSRLSITIYREPRQLSDSERVETDAPIPTPGKGTVGKTQQQGNNIVDQVPQQLGMAHSSDIHMVPPPPPPPPPPPAIWSVPSSSTAPLPSMFGPPAFVQSGHPPTTFYSNPVTFVAATVPCPPDAPPPYFGYAAPPNLQGQYLKPEVVPMPQPAFAPPPVAPSTPPRKKREKAEATPVAEPQSRWRRWFSLGKPPVAGHARTLSDSSSPAGQSRSTSPPSSPAPPPARKHRRYRPSASERQPKSPKQDRQTRQQSQPQRRNAQTSARDQRRSSPPSESEPLSISSLSSSDISTSMEAVLDAGSPRPTLAPRARTRTSTRAASDPETRRPSPDRAAHQPHIRPSDTVPLADLLHRQRARQRRLSPSPSPSPSASPSPDLQFPSPERRRGRVSFTLPEEDRGEASDIGLSMVVTSSSERSVDTVESRRGRSGQRDPRRDGGERGNERGRRFGLTGRVTGRFYRMRRALRGEN